jgi:heme/copper-type cytochrome/quinol oxidase subunit 2
MAKQMLITLAVAAIVIVIARMKRARTKARAAPQEHTTPIQSSSRRTSMIVGYSLAAIMILATAGISWTRYQEANSIVQVEVLDARSGERTIYQVRRKNLGEREFRTVDGRVVSLGASDRMERIE